jgi:hypothetical protein
MLVHIGAAEYPDKPGLVAQLHRDGEVLYAGNRRVMHREDGAEGAGSASCAASHHPDDLSTSAIGERLDQAAQLAVGVGLAGVGEVTGEDQCMMSQAKADVLVFTAFLKAHWQKIWSNNPSRRQRRRCSTCQTTPNHLAFNMTC